MTSLINSGTMRAADFIPETWWKDLDPDHLTMMGYGPDDEQEDDLADSLESDVKNVRHRAA